jgi:hypothetical protein
LYQEGAEEISSLDVLCHDVVEYYQKEESILLEPNSNKSMFIACAWTSKEESRLFQLNLFVMKIDANCHTNNKKRHLLTFTSKNVSAKAFIFLKVYLPDQKASTFCWVSSVRPHFCSKNQKGATLHESAIDTKICTSIANDANKRNKENTNSQKKRPTMTLVASMPLKFQVIDSTSN